jgi:hypothetical protein
LSASTLKDIITKLNAEMVHALRQPDVKEKTFQPGRRSGGRTPDGSSVSFARNGEVRATRESFRRAGRLKDCRMKPWN